jgi:hypothetical protein
MICNPLASADVKTGRSKRNHKRAAMQRQTNNQPLGTLERLALIAVPILFTILVVADAVHVIG